MHANIKKVSLQQILWNHSHFPLLSYQSLTYECMFLSIIGFGDNRQNTTVCVIWSTICMSQSHQVARYHISYFIWFAVLTRRTKRRFSADGLENLESEVQYLGTFPCVAVLNKNTSMWHYSLALKPVSASDPLDHFSPL